MLFKRLCLLFLPDVPRAMFIQGGTFIPDSRVPGRLLKAAAGSLPWLANRDSLFFLHKRCANRRMLKCLNPRSNTHITNLFLDDFIQKWSL